MKKLKQRKERSGSLRNIFIWSVVLLAIIILLAIAYIWYLGQQKPPSSSIQPVPKAPSAPKLLAPHKPKPDAVVGVSVQSLTTPIAPGANAAMMVHTNPEAKCTISVIYDKTPSTDSGLVAKVADEYGMVDWTWTVPPSAPLGKWPVRVTCANTAKSGVVEDKLEIKK